MDFLLMEQAAAAAEGGEEAEVVRAMDDTYIDQIAIDVFFGLSCTFFVFLVPFCLRTFYFRDSLSLARES